MHLFHNARIKWKLTLVTVVTSAIVLLLAGAALVTFETLHFRRMLVARATTLAEITGDNSAAALRFRNNADARQTLGYLENRPEIVFAGLYSSDGKLWVHFVRGPRGGPLSLDINSETAPKFEGRELLLFLPVRQDNDVVGAIGLRTDFREEVGRFNAYLAIGIASFLVVLAAALVLAARLQRIISDPLLQLAGAAERVAQQSDYTVRAEKRSNDEIGSLVDTFNLMLGRIQQQDQTLRESEGRFRQLAESINQVFWMTDPGKTQMIYVSPAYQQIWGRTCASLYQSPRDWINNIHPDDRERVLAAALAKQITGEYDEEYRIVRPGGDERWIRDRAFPIRDSAGNVLRIAGIAEDVTERKRLEREVLEISSAEQRRFGHDLHDGLGQYLTGIAMKAKVLEDILREEGSARVADAEQIVAFVNHAIGQTRSLSRGLDPVHVEAEGLLPALEELAGKTQSLFGVRCAFRAPEKSFALDQFAALQLYHVAREAVNNAIKHAKPKQIQIELTTVNGSLALRVRDDGTGLNAAQRSPDGLGLRIMRHRARAIGATFEMQSAPDQGTEVCCVLSQPSTKSTTPKTPPAHP